MASGHAQEEAFRLIYINTYIYVCVYSVGQSNLNLLWEEKVGGYKYDILIVSIKRLEIISKPWTFSRVKTFSKSSPCS